MASITFNCPNCGQKLSADKTLSESVTLCPVCEQTIRIPEFHLYPGMKIGDFVLKEKLGIGGMGEVWLAEQSSMQRLTALKILNPSLSGNQEFCTRFQYEAKNSGKLLHPNIVTAFYAGIEDEIHYLAMAYIDGVTLDTELEISGRLPEAKAIQITIDVAEALKYAWDKFKIIHRDIKPSNIMLCRDGTAKLLDLGISKSLNDNDAVTRTGIFVGTPYYISPEQARNDADVNCQTDIYALGAVLFHMLTGEVPYNATTPMGVIARHLSEPLPDLRLFHQTISPPIAQLLGKMLQKKRADRFQSWEEVLLQLQKIRHHERSPLVTTEHFFARHQKIFLYVAIIITVTALILLIASFSRNRPSPPPQDLLQPSLEDAIEVEPMPRSTTTTASEAAEVTSAPSAPTRTAVDTAEKKTAAKAARNKEKKTAQSAATPADKFPPPPRLIPDMAKLRHYLELTPEQSQRIAAIFSKAREATGNLRNKLPYADEAYKVQIHQEIQKIRQNASRQIRELLTPEQKKKFQNLEKLRHRQGGMVPGSR